MALWTQQGNPVAFQQLVARHERKAYNLALSLMKSPQAAELALHRALEQVFSDPDDSLPGDVSFLAWLLRAVTRQCLQQEDDRPDEPVRRLAVVAAGTAARDSVQVALSRMPAAERATVVLKDILGCSYTELAYILEYPAASVRSRVHKARTALRANSQLN